MRLHSQTRAPDTRSGFTIVELLVAMALVIFIMSILSEAFVTALEALYKLKATADMDQKLRTATTMLRKDLQAYHFDQALPLSQMSLPPTANTHGGFFRIYQGSNPGSSNYIAEGTDADNVPSYRATDQALHFTINLSIPATTTTDANRRENFMFTPVLVSPPPPLTQFGPAAYQDGINLYSQWAEVGWFLRATGATANGTPLFGLYRRQLLSVTNNATLNNTSRIPADTTVNALDQFPEMSCIVDPTTATSPPAPSPPPPPTGPQQLYFNNYVDLTAPVQRFGMYHPYVNDTTPNKLAGLLQNAPSILSLGAQSGGSFTLGYGGQNTAPIAYNATAANVQVAFTALPTVGNGNATVSGPAGGPFTITLLGALTVNSGFISMNPGTLSVPANASISGTTYPRFEEATWKIPMAGSDLIMTDVVSFEIKISLGNPPSPNPQSLQAGFVDLFHPSITQFFRSNPAFNPATGPMVFDTWSQNTKTFVASDSNTYVVYDYSLYNQSGHDSSMPLVLPPIRAIQVTLRVWDRKTENTRQITMVQDM